MQKAGADVIDLGCLPDTPFGHLEDTVRTLKQEGFRVSIDSADPGELRRGACAGADFVLSLTEKTLDLAAETGVTPVLIPAEHGDLDSLFRAAGRRQGGASPRCSIRSSIRSTSASWCRCHAMPRCGAGCRTRRS
jgi:hypothetical protein